MHRPLMWFTGAMIVLALVSTVGLIVDDAVITGAPAWAKPLKFSLSLALYSATFAILLPRIHRRRRLAWWFGTIIVVCGALEMVAIVGQVLRGTSSHFNVGTGMDAMVFALMGGTIVTLWVCTFGIGVLLWRQSVGDRALTWAIRLSLIIGLAAMSEGFIMTRPTAAQLESTAVDTIGAHSVGVGDGGAGLPFVGWSTTGGDLRISHFVGMHALQLLPLFAVALVWPAGRWNRLGDETTRVRLVVVIAAGYAAVTVLTLWQALRGEPLIYPGAATIVAAGLLLVAVMVGIGWALRSRPRSAPPSRSPSSVSVG